MKKKLISIFSQAYRTIFSPLTLVIWVSAILVAVVAGPFGTLVTMGLAQRAVFWGVVVSLAVFVGYTIRAVVLALVGPDRPGLFDTVAVVLMTVVFAPVVWALAYVVLSGQVPALPLLPKVFFDVFMVAGVIFVVRRLIPGIEPPPYRFLRRDDPPEQGAPEAGPEPEEEPTVQRPRLMRRLPASAQARILRLAASDHQVEVVTETAAVALRMRLKDAVDEMEPVEGYCTHRSHWVARDAIVRIRRDGPQKLFVELCNGDQVPVSRKYRPGLEEAGLLQAHLDED